MLADLKIPLVSTLSVETDAGGFVTGSGGFRSRLFPRKMTLHQELVDIYGPSFLTRYNNQSSILMCSVTCKDLMDVNSNTDYIMLLHDTRVYYFKADDEKWLELDDTIHELTTMFLNLLTTDKYRLLTAFYSFFQKLDTVFGSALLFLLVFAHEVDDWGAFFRQYWPIFLVWMIEMYYTAMEYSVKLWILTRVSLYFGFVILLLYYLAFKRCDLWDYQRQPMVVLIYYLRFAVFLIEQATTFCIDKELAFDIYQGSIKPFRNMPFARSSSLSRLQATILPDGVTLAGTICAWSLVNVFRLKDFPTPDLNHRWFLFLLLIINSFPTFFIFTITNCFLGVTSCLFCRCNNSILQEAWQEQSF